MKNVLNIYKPVGISPLDAIKLLLEKFQEYEDMPVTYAGRLDPMAEGVLVLLAGDEVHKAEEYMKLDKEYEAEILFGFQTDTYDILGMARTAQLVEPFVPEHENVEKELKNIIGNISLPLPPYSSYKIKGRPLFMWAREGKLDEIEIPMRTTYVHIAEPVGSYEISEDELLAQITKKIDSVRGDFRQEEILKKWQEVLDKNTAQKYFVVKVRFDVSSGTYIRSIAHYLGQELGTGAVLLNLVRTKVGKFDIKDSIMF